MPGTATLDPVRTDVCCLHCGEPCDAGAPVTVQGTFCCDGCRAVFDILEAHQLGAFYLCDVAPGVSQRSRRPPDALRFAALDDPAVAAHLIDFDDGRSARATFAIPSLHCASCVWLLEQFWRFDPGTSRAEVDLQHRTLRVNYRPTETSPRRIAERLAALGYEPEISPEHRVDRAPAGRRRLYVQIGVAGFALGNIMLFSIPRYLSGAPLEHGFQPLFHLVTIALSIPVLLVSAADYFRVAWLAVRHRTMALEVPVALGLAVLFLRSLADIGSGRGDGFMDSFVGLVFFLLLGRLFQQKVFDSLAFDRTFRSFLPLSVRVERLGHAEVVPIEQLVPGDRISLRRGEIVPADARLLDETGRVDYAFLTGEQAPVATRRGDTVRAGGRAATALRLAVLRPVSHSLLASLWNNPLFHRPRTHRLTTLASSFGGWFTLAATGLAAAGAIAWWPDAAASATVATAVLIVACPCALTLSAPVTLGTAMGLLGRRGIFLRQAAVVLDLSEIDLVVFDKTGTLTGGRARRVIEVGGLTRQARGLALRLARESAHPVSRAIADSPMFGADGAPLAPGDEACAEVEEIPGRGVRGTIEGTRVAVGSAAFVSDVTGRTLTADGRTWVAAGEELGWVRLAAAPRAGVEAATATVAKTSAIWLLSGDHAGERTLWDRLFGSAMRFDQSPDDKLAFVTRQRAAGRRVLMVGDGLNDAGALAAADVGLAVSDDTACVVPACDGLMAGSRLQHLPAILQFARRARLIVLAGFAVSIVYNAVGLTYALSGHLTPLASAVLMPVSSITIIALSSGLVRFSARRMLPA